MNLQVMNQRTIVDKKKFKLIEYLYFDDSSIKQQKAYIAFYKNYCYFIKGFKFRRIKEWSQTNNLQHIYDFQGKLHVVQLSYPKSWLTLRFVSEQ